MTSFMDAAILVFNRQISVIFGMHKYAGAGGCQQQAWSDADCIGLISTPKWDNK